VNLDLKVDSEVQISTWQTPKVQKGSVSSVNAQHFPTLEDAANISQTSTEIKNETLDSTSARDSDFPRKFSSFASSGELKISINNYTPPMEPSAQDRPKIRSLIITPSGDWTTKENTSRTPIGEGEATTAFGVRASTGRYAQSGFVTSNSAVNEKWTTRDSQFGWKKK
jgi:hypothetical protein